MSTTSRWNKLRPVHLGLCLTIACATFAVLAPGPGAGATTSTPTWAKLSPTTSPSARFAASMADDPATGQMVLFGGYVGAGLSPTYLVNDTWTWNGTTWTQQSPATSPPARYFASMAYDPATGHLVLFGGFQLGPGGVYTESGYLNDTWTWSGSTWTQLSPATSPPARFGASMAYDSGTGQLVLFGGGGATAGPDNDTWTWNGTTWTQLNPATSPPGQDGASMAYDSGTGQLVLFGTDGSTWTWSGSTWTQLSPATSPPAQDGASMAYDSGTGQLVLFGTDGSTWTWNGSTWTQLSPATSPSARNGASMAYDPGTGNMVLFGGAYAPLNLLSDTWVYTSIDTVAFDSDGGAAVASISGPDGTSITLPSDTGYTFDGWFTQASGGTEVGGAGSSYAIPSGGITLYAHWTSLCAAGLTPHVLNATYATGTFTGLFCVNAKGVGTYTQGAVSGIGAVTVVKGTTVIAALGKNLLLLGATNGTTSKFAEPAPSPSKNGTFTLS